MSFEREDIILETGILKGKDGNIKALIPASLTRRHDGLVTINEFTGSVYEEDDAVITNRRVIAYDGDIDQAVREHFLRS